MGRDSGWEERRLSSCPWGPSRHWSYRLQSGSGRGSWEATCKGSQRGGGRWALSGWAPGLLLLEPLLLHGFCILDLIAVKKVFTSLKMCELLQVYSSCLVLLLDSGVQICWIQAFNPHNHARTWLVWAKMNVEPFLTPRPPALSSSAWHCQIKPQPWAHMWKFGEERTFSGTVL